MNLKIISDLIVKCENIHNLIDIVFQEIDNVVLDFKQFKAEEEPIVSNVKTLLLLKKV